MNEINRQNLTTPAKGGHHRFLSFSIGREEFAMPLLDVREVIAMPEVTPLPFTPNHFLGIMNLRGQVISVIDFRIKICAKAERTPETALIISSIGDVCIGVVVDSINQVISVEDSEISEKPEIQSTKSSDYILKICRVDEKLILLIDVAKALGVDDLKLASKTTTAA